MKNKSKEIIITLLTVLISVLVIFSVVKAATVKITPPTGTPVATFYSLSEIYNFITANTTATVGSPPALDWSANLEDTQYTLTEIYSALASRISANKVKIGTTYLGVAGTLYGDTDPTKVLTVSGGTYDATQLTAGNIKLDIPFGASAETGTLAPDGTAAATDCLDTKTFFSGNSWLQKTGSIANGSDVTVTSSTPTNIPNGYYSGKTCSAALTDGTGSVAAAGQILSTYHAWDSTGAVLQGSITTQSFNPANDTVSAGYYAATTLSAEDTDLAVGNIKSGVTIFGKLGTFKSLLPDTGQTDCWDAAGTLITCGNAPAGQDAEYTSSNSATCAPSYTDNANGTITDNCTNLMWKKCSEGMTYNAGTGACDGSASPYTWANALGQCEGLTFPAGSYIDWRLPNIKELLSIVNYQNVSPAINTTAFPSTVSSYYWSSTTYKYGPSAAWSVSFGHGSVGGSGKTGSSCVRCVRGQ